MRQWGIILSLAEEFFAAVPEDAERGRTLFTVGDCKPAIYGFHGTDPRAFATARDLFHLLRARAHPSFRRVDLVSYYRSTTAALGVSNAWPAPGGAGAVEIDGRGRTGRRRVGETVGRPSRSGR